MDDFLMHELYNCKSFEDMIDVMEGKRDETLFKRHVTDGYCPECKGELIGLTQPNEYICSNCSTYCSQHTQGFKKKYRHVYNLFKVMRIYSGCSRINIPQNVIDKLTPLLKGKQYNHNLLSICKKELKEKYKNKTSLIVMIYCLVNKPIICLNYEQTKMIISLFNKVLSNWNLLKVHFKRQNVINYTWLFLKLLGLIGMTEYENIYIMKRKTDYYNSIWEYLHKILIQ